MLATNSTAAFIGNSPGFTVNGAPGSNLHGFGSGMISETRVIHLGQKRGTTGLWAASAKAAVALRGGARRRSTFGRNLGQLWGSNGVQGLGVPQVNPCEGRAGLCWAAASSPWRGCGAGSGGAPAHRVSVSGMAYGA
jgi:hypothetical protein